MVLGKSVDVANMQEGQETKRVPLSVTPLPGAFSILSYCLMPNHFHLAVRQETDIPIGKLILKVCTSYSMYFNRKYAHVGHVFQDQFKAVPITSDEQLLWLSFYIHNNPKKDGLVKRAQDWPYSSYGEYVGKGDLCETDVILGRYTSPARYHEEFSESEKEKGAPFNFELL